MQPSKCVKQQWDLRKCKLVNALADPELTAVYAESQNEKCENHDSMYYHADCS